VRGPEQSQPADHIIAEVRELTACGHQEVVLTGTEIGAYHHNGVDLKGLIARILAETPLVRLRLSSFQPPEISPELTGLWQDRRLCRHFHLSLQSGSETVLRHMKRRYSASDYQQALSRIRSAAPASAITTDIIVGFPGETDEEFADCYKLCQQLKFARIHVFPYSPRPGTEAAGMPAQVADRVKKERTRRMLALAQESARNFHKKFLGKTMTVLWEQADDGIWSGLTDNYIRTYTRSDADLTNKLTDVKLQKLWRDGVWGE
jgi:threonylcarbamoyladenosine tRNA methylthiotransferase MtaB